MKPSIFSKQLSRLLLPLLALLVWGCTPVENRQISGDLELGQSFAGNAKIEQNNPSEQQKAATQKNWWALYESEELNNLVKLAFQNNPGLNQTRARLMQAAAQARKSASSFWPQANISGTRETANGDNTPPSDYTLIGAASFELDLWGRNRATYKADNLQTKASAETLKAAGITLSATIVENWLRLLAAREEEALLHKQIDINASILDLQIRRFSMGSSKALDVLQQKETLARTKSRLPDILARQDELTHNIAILTGHSPSAYSPYVTDAQQPAPIPLPPIGLPSSLLANRPDVTAAWLNLRAADWAKQAAIANRLPSFNLSATYTTSTTALDSLFSTWLLKMAADLATPLIDGGNRRAEVWRQQALADERYHVYRETVLSAVADVENALSRNYYQDKELNALGAELKAARNTLEQAQISYTNGDQGYINVLNSLNNVQKLEEQMVRERLNLNLYRVALYRALGGQGWDNQVFEPKQEAS